METSTEKKIKLEEPQEPSIPLPALAADPEVVKVEHRFCTVCQDDVSGEVAICPKNEHYVCAVHLKEPSFKQCPMCKTPWLKARAHDLENDLAEEKEKRSYLGELMRDPALTLEQMKARFLQAGVRFWSDFYDGERLFEGRGHCPIQRAALASDRNWAFFTGEWERAVSLDMRDFCHFVWSQLNYYHVLTESPRFWEWILPRFGDMTLASMSVFLNESALDSLLCQGVVEACRIFIPYCRSKNFDLLRGHNPTKLVAGWLRYSLIRAQQMCELTGLALTAEAILEAAPRIDDAAIVSHVRIFFREIGPALWNKVVRTSRYHSEKAWDELGDEFIQAMLHFKPPGWLYLGDKAALLHYRPILLYDRATHTMKHCAFVDWVQEGMNATMHEGREYHAEEMLILPGAEWAAPLEVKYLIMITFKKHNTVRMYTHDDPGYDPAYTKMKAVLQKREIMPAPGTWIKFEYLVPIEYEKSPLF